MKGVVVGADLMYRKDGSLAPIEINTNVGWDNTNRAEEASKVFDVTDLVKFINNNNIEKVYLEGDISYRIQKLLKAVLGSSVEVNTVGAKELETLEDSDSILSIRTSYSDEALVDSFCRDKIAFLKSLEGTDLACEYLLKTADGFEGNITNVEEDYPAGIPNFILKYRYPNYNKKEYPKLLRFESLEDLKDYAEDMPEDFFLMPYYFCKNELYNDRIKLIRNFNIYVADKEGGLESIEVGKYTKVCGKLDLENVKYLEAGELNSENRSMFLTTDWFATSMRNEAALLDKGDLVWMADGSWKPIEEVKVGDYVKSLEVPAKQGYNTSKHTGNYGISVEQLEQETHYVENEVTAIENLHRFDTIVKFKFVDGSDWYDTEMSSYPTVNAKEQVEFKTLNTLKAGDSVILISLEESESPKFLVKEIAEIKKERKLLEEGYSLGLKGSHLFISRTQGEEQAYASIEHNETLTEQCQFVVIWGYNGNPGTVPALVFTGDSPETHQVFTPSGGTPQPYPSQVFWIQGNSDGLTVNAKITESEIIENVGLLLDQIAMSPGCLDYIAEGFKVSDLSGDGMWWDRYGRQCSEGTEAWRRELKRHGDQQIGVSTWDGFQTENIGYVGYQTVQTVQAVAYDVYLSMKS